MQLSQTAEYALRAVVYLAEHLRDPQTNQQIADGCRMPAGYLAKVLQPLAKGGIVSAQRGLGGGYVLEREPTELTLLDVIGAVEPVQRIKGCPLKISGHGVRLCGLHQALDDAMAAVERELGAHTIAQILEINGVKPLCASRNPLVTLGISVGRSEQAGDVGGGDVTGPEGRGPPSAGTSGD